jgi:hypothetical protein
MDDPKVNVVKSVSHQQRGVVLLTVLNATAEDSGLFWCVANNGIGGKEVRNATYLLVRRKFLHLIFIIQISTVLYARYQHCLPANLSLRAPA